MSSWSLNTPVALILFNRPDTTAQVFAAIRAARPPQLFVIADGPRASRPNEAALCAAARAVVEQVDWPCDVVRDFSDTNLGCRRRVASGLTRLFETVDRAIILEDNCIPHPTFFQYCEALLKRWQDDDRLWSISGDNFQFGRRRTSHSYYFSRYSHVWGWATWRRAWRHYDDAMSLWPELRDGGWLTDLFPAPGQAAYWRERLQATYEDRVDSWAYRWMLTCWQQYALHVLPNVNLVTSIGYGSQATHTTVVDPFANLGTQPMTFPLSHPSYMIRNAQADAYTDATIFAPPSRLRRWRRRVWAFSRRLRGEQA